MPLYRQYSPGRNFYRRLIIGGMMLSLILLFSEAPLSGISKLVSISLSYASRGLRKNVFCLQAVINPQSLMDEAIPSLLWINPPKQKPVASGLQNILAVLQKQLFCWESPRVMLQSQLPLLALQPANVNQSEKSFSFHPHPVDVPYLLDNKQLQDVPAITPAEICYRPIKNPAAVLAWLSARHSMEAAPGYLKALDYAGRQFDVNPLLLLAITGQEQSFVPADAAGAREMIRNPFNVYYSWQVFAPGFAKAALIASQTVRHLCYGCPAGMNPVHWIDSPRNPRSRYAQDTNWWRGVSIFFAQLESLNKNTKAPGIKNKQNR